MTTQEKASAREYHKIDDLRSRLSQKEEECRRYREALQTIASSDYAERCSWAEKVTEENGYPHAAEDFYGQTANEALSQYKP